ncbi:hypothetical protein GOP47_0004181 [Adiantum capillus-veneris]|uniref:Clp ATPase C-terminal domain-containing protein n=1 Tax=Adiantum capillus-veneris TaxID=13818 RepID=A0A9D4V7F0_ADICA|nr:hypothetical protein GOP47_0004181 [Adiantum capillus-veneris]
MIEEVVVRLRNNMRIEEVVVRLRDNMRILIQVSNRLEEKIVQQGFCPSYGARPLRRAITRIIEDGVAEHMLAGHLKEGDSAILDVAASSLTTIDDDVELIVNIIQS